MQNAAASLAAPLIASLLGAFLLVALVSIIWVIVSRRRKRGAAEPAAKTPAVEGTKGSLQDLERGHNAASSSQVHSMRIKASVRIKAYVDFLRSQSNLAVSQQVVQSWKSNAYTFA